jgi:hypothetical protein
LAILMFEKRTWENGDPGKIRTCDLVLRRHLL